MGFAVEALAFKHASLQVSDGGERLASTFSLIASSILVRLAGQLCSRCRAAPMKTRCFICLEPYPCGHSVTTHCATAALLLFLPSKADSGHFSSPNISVKQHCPSPLSLSVCTMCVCGGGWVGGCTFCTQLCLHHCHCAYYVLVLVQLLVAFSISMYIMCVMFVQSYGPQGRRFTHLHNYYCNIVPSILKTLSEDSFQFH